MLPLKTQKELEIVWTKTYKNLTGEPDAVKVACPVRRGDVAKVLL